MSPMQFVVSQCLAQPNISAARLATMSSEDRIVSVLAHHPGLTMKELSREIMRSLSATDNALKPLRRSGRVITTSHRKRNSANFLRYWLEETANG